MQGISSVFRGIQHACSAGASRAKQIGNSLQQKVERVAKSVFWTIFTKPGQEEPTSSGNIHILNSDL